MMLCIECKKCISLHSIWCIFCEKELKVLINVGGVKTPFLFIYLQGKRFFEKNNKSSVTKISEIRLIVVRELRYILISKFHTSIK